MQGAWWGCPSLQGVYAWPPVPETPGGSSVQARRQPPAGELPFYAMGAEMQVWLRQERGQTTLRTRAVNRARNVRNAMARQWSLITYGAAQTHCSSNMLDLKPAQAPDSDGGSGSDKGSGAVLGYRLALLKDGALALGTRRFVPGGKGSYFSWGGQSYGSYDLPDGEAWSWVKLARTGPGDREPPVEDAYVPGATTGTTNLRRPNQLYATIPLSEPVGNSIYNSLQITAQKRFSNSQRFTVSHTIPQLWTEVHLKRGNHSFLLLGCGSLRHFIAIPR